MSRDVPSGTLLIAGAAALAAVALLHPTGHEMLSGAGTMRLGVLVHALALAALPAIFLGLLGFSAALGWSRLANAALVAWGFATVATISAAVMSGFVATEVLPRVGAADGAEMYHALAWYTSRINQGFAKVNAVALAVAIVLWSAVLVRGAGAVRAGGIIGLIVGLGLLAALLSGRLGLDVHGFMVATLAQGVWLAWVGALLLAAQVGHPGSRPVRGS